MIFNKILKVIKSPKIIIFFLSDKGLMKWLPSSLYLKIIYRLRMGKPLNLKNPKTFNEKLQWLKIYDRKPLYTNLVDKYKVREYIADSIGEEYLVPIIGVFDTVDEIDFSKLPNKFVLKCTHDSGTVIICRGKNKLNQVEVTNKINNTLKQNYYWPQREWPYKHVPPRIICEEFLLDQSDSDLKDYKIMCFNGKAKCLFVCANRNTPKGLTVDFYDVNWNPLPFERHYPRSGDLLSKPQNLNRMIEISERLSKDFPFLRVDFYEVNGRLYIGELTLYPGSGFEEFTPDHYDEVLGSWLSLPNT